LTEDAEGHREPSARKRLRSLHIGIWEFYVLRQAIRDDATKLFGCAYALIK
jgi:hypothetical protein